MFFAVYAVKGTCRIVRQSNFTRRKVMVFFLKPYNRYRGKMLTVTSVLLLAFAVAAPVLRAQDWDQINGRDKLHDPTGAWLTTFGCQQFSLITFQKGEPLLAHINEEAAFHP